MNFKRFHESKNLFDESTLQNGYYGGGDDDYASYRPDDKYRAFAMNLVAGTYTLRIYCDVSIKLLRVSNSIDGRVTVATDDQPYTFTLAGDATIYVSFRNQTTTNNFPNLKVMLNTGSQPLPYEPYSSEVWHDTSHYIHKTDTDTITTLPDDIYANDTDATVGLKGNMEQTGTPTSTDPIQPQECGERTGNLLNPAIIENGYNINVNGIIVADSRRIATTTPIDVTNCTTVVLSFDKNVSASVVCVYALFDGSTLVDRKTSITSESEIDVTNGDKLYICWYTTNNSTITTDNVTNIMLNTGSTPLPYEPWGIKIPILSNSTTTNIYLGEVQTTRNLKKWVLTGQEEWKNLSSDNTRFYLDTVSPDYLRYNSRSTYYCTHYAPYGQTVSATLVPNLMMSMSSGNAQRLYITDDNFTTTDGFKAYLAQQYQNGTPVTVWYILAEPTVGIVNEPLRKFGIYADTVSGITIPTIAGANTISVDTTLQPSEVTVNYHGWHPVSAVHERENGAWD